MQYDRFDNPPATYRSEATYRLHLFVYILYDVMLRLIAFPTMQFTKTKILFKLDFPIKLAVLIIKIYAIYFSRPSII